MQPEKKPFSFKNIFIGKKKYWLTALILILIAVSIYFFKNSKKSEVKTIAVSIGSITQEVSVTGAVKASDFVELAFEKSGKVARASKNVGDKVSVGEVIASLDNGIEEATLESAEAKYAELSKGSRIEEIRVAESSLSASKQALTNDYAGVIDTITDAYNKADNAVNTQTDPIFSNDQTANPDLTFNVSSLQTKNDAIASRISTTGILKDFKTLIDNAIFEKTPGQDSSLDTVKSYLISVQSFLIKTSAVLDSTTNLSETNISTYKTAVSTGRTNVNTALKAVNDLTETIASQKIAVEKAERELALKKLGATKEVLDQAAAEVKSAEASLRKTIIRSPINGIITKQDAKVGEIATANKPIVSVMGLNNFKIEANVPEVDSTKLEIGNLAKVTLDAYGSDIEFSAKIISIDPAENIIDGVSTYKTTFLFINEPKPIRSGMTANIDVKTKEKPDILVIPQRSVSTKNGKKIVQIVDQNGKTVEREVETGLKGSDGMIEITSGLSEGERVINYVK